MSKKLLPIILCLFFLENLYALPPVRVERDWIDSLGERIRDSDETYTLPSGTLIFHNSIWLDFTFDINKWYAVDLPQAIMHNRNMAKPGQSAPEYFAIHVFRTKRPLVLNLINPYSKKFAAIKAMNKDVDPMGQRPEVTESLVEAVCKLSHGWRNPWDQDEIMLCRGNSASDSLTYIGTIQFQQTRQNITLKKESPVGSARLSDATIGPLFGAQNGTFSFAIRDYLTGTALSQGSYFTAPGRPVVDVSTYFWPSFYTVLHRGCSGHINKVYNDCSGTVEADLDAIIARFRGSDISAVIAQILARYNCGATVSQSTFPYFGSLRLLEKTDDFEDNMNTPHHVDLVCTPK